MSTRDGCGYLLFTCTAGVLMLLAFMPALIRPQTTPFLRAFLQPALCRSGEILNMESVDSTLEGQPPRAHFSCVRDNVSRDVSQLLFMSCMCLSAVLFFMTSGVLFLRRGSSKDVDGKKKEGDAGDGETPDDALSGFSPEERRRDLKNAYINNQISEAEFQRGMERFPDEE